MHSRLLDVAEAAEQLGISPRTLYKWAESGRVPFVKIGRLLRFRGQDLVDWIGQQLHKTPENHESRLGHDGR